MAVKVLPSEEPLGHSLLASQPVSPALGLSSLRQESPLLSIPPAMHLRASPLPCQLPVSNWVLTPLYFTVSIISLSLLSPLSIYLPEPFSSLLFTAATTQHFFLEVRGVGAFQGVSTFSILRCEIHFDTGLEIEWNWQYAPICPSLFPTLSLPDPSLTHVFPPTNPWNCSTHLTVFYHLSRKIRVCLPQITFS